MRLAMGGCDSVLDTCDEFFGFHQARSVVEGTSCLAYASAWCPQKLKPVHRGPVTLSIEFVKARCLALSP